MTDLALRNSTQHAALVSARAWAEAIVRGSRSAIDRQMAEWIVQAVDAALAEPN